MHILCLHRHTHTHTALGQDLTNGCCRTYWWWWVFPLCRGRTRCSRSAFIPPDQGQAKVLPPSQSSEITQPCLLRESHNTHNTQPPVKQLQLSQVLLILLSTALWCWFLFLFFLLQMKYNCNSFKHICQIFIPDLGQCKCVYWGQTGRRISWIECVFLLCDHVL